MSPLALPRCGRMSRLALCAIAAGLSAACRGQHPVCTGLNQFGLAVADEELLASKEVVCVGETIAVVVATSRRCDCVCVCPTAFVPTAVHPRGVARVARVA